MIQTIDTYLLADRAEQIFLHPGTEYSWHGIMKGVRIEMPNGRLRTLKAVDKSTLRSLHRQDQSKPVGEHFFGYFIDNRERLVSAISELKTRGDLDKLSNTMCDELRMSLSHLKPAVLAAYHRLRKPVDLALEHLVSMSRELAPFRRRLVPLLFLPIDSKVLGSTLIFTDQELRDAGLSRTSSFGELKSRAVYLDLQGIVTLRAEALAMQLGRPFHSVYFDILWGDRFASIIRVAICSKPSPVQKH